MQAIAINNFGTRRELKLMELPQPQPGVGEVLIEVKAAGVNPVDWKVRAGLLRFRLPHQFPIILGWDAAGQIAAVGPGVRRFKRGEAVFAYCRKAVVKDGAYAEYVVVPETSVARKPATASYAEAASVPLAGLTAFQALFEKGGLKRGQTVLIHAGGGGVGGFAVQLARHAGAHVITTASRSKQACAREYGAELVIDYHAEDFRKAVRRHSPKGVDLVFDTVGGDVQKQSAAVVRPGGVLVSILAFDDLDTIRRRGVKPEYLFVSPSGAQLATLAALMEEGELRTRLAKVFPLQDAAKAHALIEKGHTRGKIVLRV